MDAPKPQRRKPATPHARRVIKASVSIPVELHARLSAAASLRGTTNNGIILDALAESLRGIVVSDRSRSGGPNPPAPDDGATGLD